MTPLDATPAAPAAPDFDAMPMDQLNEIVQTGVIPETPPAEVPTEGAPATPAPESPAADAAPAPGEPEPEPAAEPAAEEEPAAEAAAAANAADPLQLIENFQFTPDADPETRAREKATYLSMMELPAPLQAMIEADQARLAELEAAAPVAGQSDPVAQRHSDAFDALVTLRETPDGFVPNTEPVIQLLTELYPKESEQLLTDMLLQPSGRFAGHTRFQEILRVATGLGDSEMQVLDTFLANGGKMPHPSFVPLGVDDKVLEAYWTDPQREQIDETIRNARVILNEDEHATPEEKATAQREIEQINQQLARVQKGLDADAREKQLTQQVSGNREEKIRIAAIEGYTNTTLSLLDQQKNDLAKALTMFTPQAAAVTASSFSMLITTALSDSDAYARNAQKQLSDQGIRVDWKKAGEAVNRLYDAERRIAAHEQSGSNPRSVEIEQRNKRQILLEIKGLEKNLTGQIVATLTKGAGQQLQASIGKVPTGKPAPVRPRLNGDAPAAGTKPDFDKMPLSDINKYLEGRHYLESAAANS